MRPYERNERSSSSLPVHVRRTTLPLSREAFTRSITAASGIARDLPPGEFSAWCNPECTRRDRIPARIHDFEDEIGVADDRLTGTCLPPVASLAAQDGLESASESATGC